MLTRKLFEEITITCPNGDVIRVVLTERDLKRSCVRIGIDAPMDYQISRPDAVNKNPKERP